MEDLPESPCLRVCQRVQGKPTTRGCTKAGDAATNKASGFDTSPFFDYDLPAPEDKDGSRLAFRALGLEPRITERDKHPTPRFRPNLAHTFNGMALRCHPWGETDPELVSAKHCAPKPRDAVNPRLGHHRWRIGSAMV